MSWRELALVSSSASGAMAMLLVSIGSMTAKSRAGRNSKNSVPWKGEKAVRNFVHTGNVAKD